MRQVSSHLVERDRRDRERGISIGRDIRRERERERGEGEGEREEIKQDRRERKQNYFSLVLHQPSSGSCTQSIRKTTAINSQQKAFRDEGVSEIDRCESS